VVSSQYAALIRTLYVLTFLSGNSPVFEFQGREITQKKLKTFRTRWKFEIKNTVVSKTTEELYNPSYLSN
jgi:hypothetical protein